TNRAGAPTDATVSDRGRSRTSAAPKPVGAGVPGGAPSRGETPPAERSGWPMRWGVAYDLSRAASWLPPDEADMFSRAARAPSEGPTRHACLRRPRILRSSLTLWSSQMPCDSTGRLYDLSSQSNAGRPSFWHHAQTTFMSHSSRVRPPLPQASRAHTGGRVVRIAATMPAPVFPENWGNT